MEIRHFLLWLPMIPIAFANAALREWVFSKYFSELSMHQLSTATLIILCSVYVWFTVPVLRIQSNRQALLIGFAWMLLTVTFEFSLGRLTHKSWEYLFRDYDLFAGRIWVLFLLSLLILPYVMYVLRDK